MIVKTSAVILILGIAWLKDVSGASFSKVFVERDVRPVEYYQYGPPVVSSARLSQLNTAPVQFSVPSVSSIVSSCGSPCIIPTQNVPSVAPSTNVITYKSQIPSVPVMVTPTQNEPTGYEYSYVVYDENTGDHKAQRELSDGSVVRGEYSFLQPDGYVREVQYVADDVSGFNAVVKNFLPAGVESKKKVEVVEKKELGIPCHEVQNESIKERSEENSEEKEKSGKLTVHHQIKHRECKKDSSEESKEELKESKEHSKLKESGGKSEESEESKEKHEKTHKKDSKESEEASKEEHSKKHKKESGESKEGSAEESKETHVKMYKKESTESKEESEEKSKGKHDQKHKKDHSEEESKEKHEEDHKKESEESKEESKEKHDKKHKTESQESKQASKEESEEKADKKHKKESGESGEESKDVSKEKHDKHKTESKEVSKESSEDETKETHHKKYKKESNESESQSKEKLIEEIEEIKEIISHATHANHGAPLTHELAEPEHEDLVPYQDIVRCVQAAINRANETPSAHREQPSPLTYIILNKPC